MPKNYGAPNLVHISKLPELVPGTTKNFWYQRSRLNVIPGQMRCGNLILVDLDVFFPALKAGKIDRVKNILPGR